MIRYGLVCSLSLDDFFIEVTLPCYWPSLYDASCDAISFVLYDNEIFFSAKSGFSGVIPGSDWWLYRISVRKPSSKDKVSLSVEDFEPSVMSLRDLYSVRNCKVSLSYLSYRVFISHGQSA